MRVAFLTNIVSPYRRPVFEALAAMPGWNLRVIVNAKNEFDRAWDETRDTPFDLVVSKSWSFVRKHVSHEPVRTEQVVTRYIPVGLFRDLSRFDPDVVITHELGPRSLIAAAWCRLHKRPLIVWSYQSLAGATARGLVRRLVRRAILGRADRVVGMGRQARTVLENFAVPAAKIIDAPNASDNRLLLARLARSRGDGTIERLRSEIADGRRIVLMPGRLVPYKGIERLLELWRAVPESIRDGWRLVFVGDGPLSELVESAHDLGVIRRPSVPMADVADYYGIADLHVFPSLADCWGLVVNEAMLCGVPSLCSIRAGCSDDLIVDGINGLSFDPTDSSSAGERLSDALTRDDLEALGAAAAKTGAEFTIERLVSGFRDAVEAVCHRAPKPTARPSSAGSNG